jgi:two-component system, sensor histidine kinase
MTIWQSAARREPGPEELFVARAELDLLFPAHVLLDPDGTIRAVGPSLSRLAAGDLIGRDVGQVFQVDLYQDAAAPDARPGTVTLTMERPHALRLRGTCLRREDEVWLLVGHQPQHDATTELVAEDFAPSDAAADLICTARETADRLKRSEALVHGLEEQKLAAEAACHAKSTFLATMSHEIRTPMNGVLGLASLLGKTELSTEQRELLDVIMISGQALMGILNDVLDLSKVESGSTEIECTDFRLQELLSGLEAMFRPQASKKGLDLIIDMDAPPPLRGDPARIRQILVNLLSNAIKFTESGQVTLTAAFQTRTRRTGKLLLTVRDSGIGMAPIAIDRIFQPYVQADSSTTRRFGGTGLGLAIVRKLVDLLGGKIAIESRLGVGSVFRVELPVESARTAQAPAAPAQTSLMPLPDLSAGGHRVLLAEDNLTNQFLMKRFLDKLGVASHLAADGREVLLAWKDGAYDLILMDVEMPVLDGLEAAREIRRRESCQSARRIPIIGLSADASAEGARAALAAGMDAFMTKPISIEKLAAAIEQTLAPSREAS